MSFLSALLGGSADPTLAFAFAAGLASFLSPCVLPVIPAFVAHLGGTTLAEGEVSRRRLFLSSVLFVAGFSLVFGVLGVALNSVFRDASTEVLAWLSRLAGAVIVLFGLHLAGLVEFDFLLRERAGTSLVEGLEPGYLTSFLFGAAFAVGWTPCVGPLLGSVLSVAVTNPAGAFPLLISYSVGLGMPFLLVGLFPVRITGFLKGRAGRFSRVGTFFGYVLVALGVLVFTQNLALVANLELLNEAIL